MKAIRSVHLIGLGAIGGVYAALLHDLDPGLLTVIAGDERRERYERDGVAINGERYEFRYRAPGVQGEAADLILICVKDHHLDATIRDIEASVGESTVILSLLNGITSEERIGERYGIERLLYSFCVGTDATRVDTGITYQTVGTVVFGERVNEDRTERVTAVTELFDRAGIPWRVPKDMIRELWWKFMMNVGINPTSAILRAPYGNFSSIPEARELFTLAAREAVALSGPAGVDLKESDIEECLTIFETLSPEGKTSMFQDIEAGRKTEIGLFAGTVVELGRTYAVPTPVNAMLLRMIRVLEKRSGAV